MAGRFPPPTAKRHTPRYELHGGTLIVSSSPSNLHQLASLLVVEVRSPNTAAIDRTLKRSAYADLGVKNYWMVDADHPRIEVLELVDGAYREAGSCEGDNDITIAHPFIVTLNPARLAVP